jgi:L-seryl-tRNA(Ser) seleniumtransferase
MPHPLLRELPPVGALLDHPAVAPLAAGRRRAWVTRVVQRVVDDLRRELSRRADREDDGPLASRDDLLAEAARRIAGECARLRRPALRRVLNGTGVIVHTNLGRANYPESAVAAMALAARHGSDLEFVLETNLRGHRGRKVEEKAALLAGAEDALIVNNNAAAVWLCVRHLAAGGKPLILSRGEVVAIGGSFRMHEILAETGCRLVEIGTTNRTGLRDYEQAMQDGAVVLKVHRSNFTVSGFTEEVALADLAAACRRRGCPLVYDAGSGALFEFGQFGLPGEATLADDVAAGCDLVTCSGDKLLGGGQAGIILGSRDRIAALRQHPMRRALRVDKTTLAALDAVLTLYLDAEDRPAVPTLDTLARPVDDLAAAAARLGAALAPVAPAGWRSTVVADVASVGGGSFSDAEVPTRLLRWEAPREQLEAMHGFLRGGDPALVCRISQEALSVDLRTIAPPEEGLVAAAFRDGWSRLGER